MSRIANAVRAGKRSFDAASGSGRWPPSANLWAQNSQSLQARNTITRRANYLAHNSPSGASFVESWVTALIGNGPTVRAAHPDPDVRADLEGRFSEWALRADIEGVGDLAGLLQTAVRSLVQSGDAVFHMPVDISGNLNLRLLASEQLDSSRTIPSLGMTGIGSDAPRVISGVESDSQGRRVAYWLLDAPPDAIWASIFPSTRVPAEDVAHLFIRKFPGQVRGISWLTPVASRLVELDALEDAALVKARTAALFAAFVCDPENQTGLYDATGTDPFNPANVQLEPGLLQFLPPGTDIKFTPPVDAGQIDGLLRYMQRSVAAGGGLPYENLSGDLSQVNFSSARLGQAVFQRRVKALQGSLLEAQFLVPVWRRWVLLEFLSGRLHAPDFQSRPLDYLNAKFLWPQLPAIDPLKQAKADALDLASRTKSRAQIIAENSGRDVSDVDDELEDDPFYVADPAAAAALLAQPEQVQNANQ
jgi:lambda family phage portal protein